MTRERATVVAAFLVACMVVALPALAQQQGRGQRRRGWRGSFLFIERSWTIVCFGLDASQEQINKLRPAYQDAWKTRADALNKLRAAQDRRAAFQEFATTLQMIRTDLEKKLAEVLTKDQQEKLRQMLQGGMFGGRRRGGGGR